MEKEKTKKIGLGLILGWGLGILLVVGGILELFSKPGAGFFTFLAGLVIFPPFVNFVKQKTNFELSRALKIILFLVLLGVSGALIGATTSTNSQTGSGSANQEQSQQGGPTPTTDPHPHFGDGTFVVGKDIQPGTYRTRVASSGCYYERLSGFGGSLGEIIANDNTDFPAIVTIAVTDKGFKSQNCGTWTQNVSQITSNKTSFGDGMYIVGTDIQPGTYKSSGQSGCYYARLSNFSDAGTDGIIDNENTDSAAIVTIAATDAGFKSNSCGTWTLQQ